MAQPPSAVIRRATAGGGCATVHPHPALSRSTGRGSKGVSVRKRDDGPRCKKNQMNFLHRPSGNALNRLAIQCHLRNVFLGANETVESFTASVL